MKTHLSNALRGFVCGMGAGALGALLIALMLALYDVPRTVYLSVLPWALLLLVIALVCEALLARGTNLLVLLLASGACLAFGGEQIVMRTVFDPASGGFPVLLRLMVYTSGVCCMWAMHKLPPSDVFVRLGDVLIGVLTTYLAACFLMGDAIIAPVAGFALLSLALCLLTAASLRAGGESERVVRGAGAGGMFIVFALLLLCVLLASALLSLVSGQVGSIVDLLLMLWRAAVAVLSRVFEVFVRIIALFAPKPVSYNMTAAPEDSFVPGGAGLEITAQMPQWVIYLFIAFLAALLAAAVLAILFALRHTKLSRSPRRAARRVTRKSHALAALLARLRALRDAAAFHLAYRKNRRTPQGLYVLALRACRLSRRRKRPGESPSAFIRRLHAQLLDASGLSTLDALADKLERALYSGERVPLSRGESDAFAAQIQAVSKLPHRKNPASA